MLRVQHQMQQLKPLAYMGLAQKCSCCAPRCPGSDIFCSIKQHLAILASSHLFSIVNLHSHSPHMARSYMRLDAHHPPLPSSHVLWGDARRRCQAAMPGGDARRRSQAAKGVSPFDDCHVTRGRFAWHSTPIIFQLRSVIPPTRHFFIFHLQFQNSGVNFNGYD